MEKQLKAIQNFRTLPVQKVQIDLKTVLYELMDKYNAVSNTDKLMQAQSAVDNVQIIMQDNMKKMIENNQLQ